MSQASQTRMHSDQAQSTPNEFPNSAAQIRNTLEQTYNDTSNTPCLNTNSGVPDSVDVADASYDSLMWAYEGSIGRNGPTALMPAAMSNSDQSFSALEWAYGLMNRSDTANYSAANWSLANQQG